MYISMRQPAKPLAQSMARKRKYKKLESKATAADRAIVHDVQETFRALVL